MEIQKKTLQIFQDNRGKEPFSEWIKSLSRAHRARIFAKLDRVETGNLGDFRSVGEGVFELRFHFGAGYRMYFGEVDKTSILLLCGGDKSSQKKDIQQAKAYWKEDKQRKKS